jgi:short-subunit dehydrogenase
MDLAMRDKKAIVTGASEGIGKAIARALAREGVDVAICARRKELLEKKARRKSPSKPAGRSFRSSPI